MNGDAMKPETKLRGNGLNTVKIDFSTVKDMTLGQLYGEVPVPITALTKKLWELIKTHNLKVKKEEVK